MQHHRYRDKPLLKLLELNILRVIGELPDGIEMQLRELEPLLRNTYNLGGNWHEVINSVMGITPDTELSIKEAWRNEITMARERKVTLDAQDFVEAVVDQNFM